MIDAIEGRVALIHPLSALGGAFRKLLAARDVVGQSRAKLGGRRRNRGSGRAVVVRRQCALQRVTGCGDGAEVRGAPRLEIFAYRAIEGDQPFEDRARATGQRLAFALHRPNRFGGLAGGPPCQFMAHENHGRHRRQTQSQAAADPNTRSPATTARRYRGGQGERLRNMRLGGSVLHMT